MVCSYSWTYSLTSQNITQKLNCAKYVILTLLTSEHQKYFVTLNMRKSSRDTKIFIKIDQYIYDSCVDDAKSEQKSAENSKFTNIAF